MSDLVAPLFSRSIPSAVSLRRMLLLTTTLVTLIPVLGGQARAEYVINNGTATAPATSAVTGDWAAASPIWYDSATSAQVALPAGGTAVLRNPNGNVTLNVQGTIAAGGFSVEDDGFTLAGGTLGTNGGQLNFLAAGGTKSLSASSDLLGTVLLQSQIRLEYSGVSTSMTAIRVLGLSELVNTGTTSGEMFIRGTVTHGGTHLGNVVSEGTFKTQGPAQINGVLSATGTSTTTVQSGDELRVSGGVDNGGTLNVSGKIDVTGPGSIGVTNSGTTNLTSATIAGNVVNTGTVQVSGDGSTVSGDFGNAGTLRVNGGGSAKLGIGGRLTSSGTISGNMTITAKEILLSDSAIVDSSATLRGTEVNRSVLRYDTDQSLSEGRIDGGLLNEGPGTVEITADLHGSNYDVTNRATFDVRNGGSLRFVDNFNNEGPDATATVHQGGSLSATNIINSGMLINRGVITGDVRNDGNLDLTNRIDGKLFNNGTLVVSEGNATVGELRNQGGVTISQGRTLTSGTDVNNSGNLTVEGTLANNLTNTAQGTLTSGGRIVGNIINHGTATLEGVVDGRLNNFGVADINGDLAVNDARNDGTLTIAAGVNLTSNRVIQNNQSGTLNSAGTITGNVVNDGDAVLSGRVEGMLTNNSQTDVSKALSVKTLQNDGTISLNTGGRLTTDDAFTNNGTVRLVGGTFGGDLKNDGNIQVLANSRVDGDLENLRNGRITGNPGDYTLTVGDTFFNNGIVEAGAGAKLTISAQKLVFGEYSRIQNDGNVRVLGVVENGGTMTYTAPSTIYGNISNTKTGRIEVFSTVDANNNNITNAGTVVVGQNPTAVNSLTNLGTFTNSGQLTIQQNSTLEADRTDNIAGGIITLSGNLNTELVTAAGSQTELLGGTITGPISNGGLLTGTGTINGALTNSGTARIGGTAGSVTNTGTFQTNGNLGVAGLNNTGGTATVRTGHTLTSASTVTNAATLDIAGTLSAALTNQTAGTTTLSGGTVTDAITNAGTLTGRGTLQGALTNSGTATLAGTAADITNSGTLNTNGTLTVATLTNSGAVNVNGGNRLVSANTVTSTGSMNVAGTVDAALDLQTGSSTTLSGGTLARDVTNAGTLSGTGRTEGALLNTGTVRLDRGDTLTTVQALNNQGQVAVAGRLAGGLDNSAAGTATLNGGTVTGAVTNAGTLTGYGTLSGALTNTGTVDLAGTAATVANSNVFGTAGDLTLDGLENTGTATVDAGHTLTVNDALANGATLNVAGTLAGAGNATLTNQATGAMTLTGGTLSGTVVNAGTLTGSGALAGALVNSGTLNVAAGQAITSRAAVTNSGTVRLAGSFDGNMTNGPTGAFTLEGGRLDGRLTNRGALTGSGTVGGLIDNTGTVTVAQGETLVAEGGLQNANELAVTGALTGEVTTLDGATTTLNGGSIAGTILNQGTLTGNGRLTGTLTNDGTVTLTGSAGTVINNDLLSVNAALAVKELTNTGTTAIGTHGVLTSATAVENSGAFRLAGTLGANLANMAAGTVTLTGGRVSGNVVNSGTMTGSGTVTNTLTNTGTLRLAGMVGTLNNSGGEALTLGDLTVQGRVVNQNRTVNAGPLARESLVGGPLVQAGVQVGRAAPLAARVEQGRFVVSSGTTLTARGGVLNDTGALFRVGGTLAGDVENRGAYVQTGTLNGSLRTSGAADLGGQVTGDVVLADGTLTLRDAARIDGMLDLHSDLSVERGRRVLANMVQVRPDATLTVAGTVAADVNNVGTVSAVGQSGRITGVLTNVGTIDMTDGSTAGVLTVGGLAGHGRALMDINTSDLGADRIVVSGGRTTGRIDMSFVNLGAGTVNEVGRAVTLIDVDETFGRANDFTYTPLGVDTASERIVYSLLRENGTGDLQIVSQVNPAIGAMFANVALVQSLIGSVINRPASPYVTGLATDPGDKPCGFGGWGRALGGHATVTGMTDNQVSQIENKVRSEYLGMQGGADMACFRGEGGWNTAFGVLGGVNTGTTVQPIYSISGIDATSAGPTLSSITSTEFQQVYGGVYATATRDRLQADLQLRVERTDFSIENKAVGSGSGLGLDQSDFSSTGVTLSGAVSYMMPLGNSGINFTPTTGFSWSKMSTDSLSFSDGYQLDFKDSERQVVFVGGTLSKTFVQAADNSALQTFATATYYKDFADPAVSVLSNPGDASFEPQRLTSDNLDQYGELSFGASYVKVLNPGSAGKPRQFSTSARIDTRFGESIDSVGVTGQVRWQF